MKDGSGGNLGSSRKYSEKLFRLMFYPLCVIILQCPNKCEKGSRLSRKPQLTELEDSPALEDSPRHCLPAPAQQGRH